MIYVPTYRFVAAWLGGGGGGKEKAYLKAVSGAEGCYKRAAARNLGVYWSML